MKRLFILFIIISSLTATPLVAAPLDLSVEGERHLTNIKQLTFGGENAEAYFSFDGKKLIFQSKRDGRSCDQIYSMNLDGSNVQMVSNGEGRTTCGYFLKDGKRLLYASTFRGNRQCPAPLPPSETYAWSIDPDFEIYSANSSGKDIRPLTNTPGYDAEATISPNGKRIVFTSERDGDLDIYSMDTNGRNVKRLTNELGYDGGPFYSPDSKMIVYRSSHPKTPDEVKNYKDLLSQHKVVPTTFDIWVMAADGTKKRRVTNLGSGSFAPFFTPDGKRIIFGTNYFATDPRKRNFDIAMINIDGTGLERITFNETFDGFPMFSPDGKKLVFASNRNASKPGETNVFIADWEK